MYKFKNKIKEENKQIIGIEPVVDLEHFLILLLADLASKSNLHYYCDEDISTVCISPDYKKIIEKIMYEENDLGIKYASLFDICEYYSSQKEWERKLGNAFKNALDILNKRFKYDFEYDELEFDFTTDEINNIKSMYDEETLLLMNDFSDLFNNYSHTRKLELSIGKKSKYKNDIKIKK